MIQYFSFHSARPLNLDLLLTLEPPDQSLHSNQHIILLFCQVNRNAGTIGSVVLHWELQNSLEGDGSTDGIVSTAGTIQFAPGQASGFLSIQILNDGTPSIGSLLLHHSHKCFTGKHVAEYKECRNSIQINGFFIFPCSESLF